MGLARLTRCSAIAIATVSCTHDFDALLGEQAAASTGTGGAVASSSGGADGGTGAAGGTGASGSGGAGGQLPACPTGAPLKGGPMVPIPAAPKPYCMDVREVSNGEYEDFLADMFMFSSDLPECSWNTTGKPAQLMQGCVPGIPMAPPVDHPVVCVDWCDAWEYCHWAGKRLCGKIGSPTGASFSAVADAGEGQWYRACSRAGTQTYPYGPEYQSGSCNDANAAIGATAPVASSTDCVGGYDGLMDMSGNVREWEHSCDANDGQTNSCHHRGGSFSSPPQEEECGVAGAAQRDQAFADLGFRCCLDLE